MNAKDTLKMQYHFFYRTAKANLEGITAEESVRQPTPGGNCANWILGHLVRAQNGVMGLVGEGPVWESDQLDRAADDPITDAEGAIDWDTLVERFMASEGRFMAALDGLGEAQLDEGGFTDPFGGERTRGEMLGLMVFHQGYHAGQLGLSRRLAGHEGAVGAPRPQGASA